MRTCRASSAEATVQENHLPLGVIHEPRQQRPSTFIQGSVGLELILGFA